MVNGSNPCDLLKMKKRYPAETMVAVFTFETFVTVTELIKANAGRQEVTAAGFVSFERKSLHQTS